MPIEVRVVAVCQALNLSYTELQNQPAWWVDRYQIYLNGKAKAEREKIKRSRAPKK